MSNGRIEAEIEPLPECPSAHIGQKHSWSAHREVLNVLGQCGIKFRTMHDVPPACLDPAVDRPRRFLHWKVFVAAFAAAARRLLV